MSKAKWVSATVTYLRQGSYSIGNYKFIGNRTRSIDSKNIVDMIRDRPFFSVMDTWEEEEEEVEEVLEEEEEVEASSPEPPKPKQPKKGRPVKKTKKVRKTGVN